MRDGWRKTWRGSRYLLLGLPTAMATMMVLPLLAAAALSTGLGGIGLVLFPRAVASLRRWAEWHRRRAAALLGRPVSPRRMVLGEGIRARWRQVLDDPEARRDVRWAVRHIVTGVPAGFVAVACIGQVVFPVFAAPLWWVFPIEVPLRLLGAVPVTGWGSALGLGAVQIIAFAALTYWAVPRLATFHASRCLAALEPSAQERLTERVGELTESRAGVLDAHGAELRRIERDLHDGTQARLVAIAMRLGVAREALTEDGSADLADLLRQAHEGTEEAMAELREVVRSIYPPILADRGLPAALAALATRSGVPAEIDLGELGALPAAVEAAAYYVVAETLTNAAKHSGATQVRVRLTRERGCLLIEVTDNGVGGVDESGGSGVTGIRHRVAALDGTMIVTSPAGGPTAVTVELPCAS
ncbi:sensor histidine kinase [Nonomuraea fuscirosea]|uniref:sensor histidine kinase n=1 Tax=Nonomuraea fuscirosea TaxID=1291556 RepID=UPI0034245E17